MSDRNGLTRTFEYDTLNRQTKENWVSAGTIMRSFLSQYDGLNQLVDATGQLGTGTKLSEYGYDDLDRVRTIDNQGTEGVARVLLNYSHNKSGFNWDYRNRFTGVTDTAGLSVSYSYDADNQRLSKTIGGMTTRYVYIRQRQRLPRFQWHSNNEL